MIRGVQSALAVRRQRSLRVQPPGRRGSAVNSTSSLAGSDRRASILSTKVSNSSVTMFHIGIVFIVLGTILIITSLIPGHVRTDQWDDLFGTGCFLFLIGGLLGLINRMIAKDEDEKLNSFVQRKLARSKSGLPAHDDDDLEGGRHHHHQHQRRQLHLQHHNNQHRAHHHKQKSKPSKSATNTTTTANNGTPRPGGEEPAGAGAVGNTHLPCNGSSPVQSLDPIVEEQQQIRNVIIDGAPRAEQVSDDVVGVHQVRIEDHQRASADGEAAASGEEPSSGQSEPPSAKAGEKEEDAIVAQEDLTQEQEEDETAPLNNKTSKFALPRQKSSS